MPKPAVAEIHNGCGGVVKLFHDKWRCLKCGAGPIGVSEVHAINARREGSKP